MNTNIDADICNCQYKDNAARLKKKNCNIRIYTSSNVAFSRETSQPTAVFNFWLPYKQLINTNKKTQDAIEMTCHYIFFNVFFF